MQRGLKILFTPPKRKDVVHVLFSSHHLTDQAHKESCAMKTLNWKRRMITTHGLCPSCPPAVSSPLAAFRTLTRVSVRYFSARLFPTALFLNHLRQASHPVPSVKIAGNVRNHRSPRSPMFQTRDLQPITAGLSSDQSSRNHRTFPYVISKSLSPNHTNVRTCITSHCQSFFVATTLAFAIINRK